MNQFTEFRLKIDKFWSKILHSDWSIACNLCSGTEQTLLHPNVKYCTMIGQLGAYKPFSGPEQILLHPNTYFLSKKTQLQRGNSKVILSRARSRRGKPYARMALRILPLVRSGPRKSHEYSCGIWWVFIRTRAFKVKKIVVLGC